jgi:outer membrane protein assembly factor BamB
MADHISPAIGVSLPAGSGRKKIDGETPPQGPGDAFVQSSQGEGADNRGRMASTCSGIPKPQNEGALSVSAGDAASVILDKARIGDISCTAMWDYDIHGELLGELCPGKDGTVYFATSQGKLLAVNSGREIWSFPLDHHYLTAPEITPDGTLYVAGDSTLYAIKDGEKKWELKLGKATLNTPAVGDDGTIYATSHMGKLFAVKDGKKQWTFSSSGLLQSNDPFLAPPCAGPDGTVYAGTKGGKVFAVKDGKQLWEFQVDGSFDQPPVIGPGGTLIVGTEQGEIIGLKDGKRLWNIHSNARLHSPLNVDADGTVYFVGADGQFHFAGGWTKSAVAIKNGSKLWSVRGDEYAGASSKALVSPGVFFTGDPYSFHAASDGKTIQSMKKRDVGYTAKPPSISPDGILFLPVTSDSISAFSLSRPLADLVKSGGKDAPPKSAIDNEGEFVSIDGLKLPVNKQTAMNKLSLPAAEIKRRKKEK